jgi:sporulation protein YlmC with PRC-barrel domain
MLLSDLFDRPVRSPQGELLGRVVDVRFRRSARNGRREGDLELIALVVSPRSRLSYYGYERGAVNAPAVISKFVEWLHRDSRIIPWECVARVDDDRISLGVQPPSIPLDPRRGIDPLT